SCPTFSGRYCASAFFCFRSMKFAMSTELKTSAFAAPCARSCESRWNMICDAARTTLTLTPCFSVKIFPAASALRESMLATYQVSSPSLRAAASIAFESARAGSALSSSTAPLPVNSARRRSRMPAIVEACCAPWGTTSSALAIVCSLLGEGSGLAGAARQRAARQFGNRGPVRLEAETGIMRQLEPAVDRPWQAAEDLLARQHRDRVVFDEATVRESGVQMHVVEWPGTAVAQRNVPCLRHAGDALALRVAAADHDVGLRDVERARGEEIGEARRQPFVLPRRQRHRAAATQF